MAAESNLFYRMWQQVYKNLSIVNACEGLNLLSEEDEGEEHAHGDAHEDAAEEHIHGDTEDTHEDGHNHGDVNAHAWMEHCVI